MGELCSNSNDTLVRSCHDHGVCSRSLSNASSSYCVCSRGYTWEDRCKSLVSNQLYPRNAILAISGIVIEGVLLLLILAEVVVDLRLHRAVSWKKPALIAKLILLVNFIVRITERSMSLYEIFNETLLNDVLMSVLPSLGVCFIAAILGLITVGWVSIVMKSLSLGSSNRHLKRYRIFVFVFICVLTPISIVTTILSSLVISAVIMYLITAIIIFLLVLVIVLGTTYPIVKTIFWTCSRRAGDTKTSKTVRVKSIFLLIINVVLIVFIFSLVALLVLGGGSNSEIYFNWTAFGNACTFLVVACFFLFLQNYFIKFGFLRGYYLGFRGEIGLSANSAILKSDIKKRGNSSSFASSGTTTAEKRRKNSTTTTTLQVSSALPVDIDTTSDSDNIQESLSDANNITEKQISLSQKTSEMKREQSVGTLPTTTSATSSSSEPRTSRS